MRRITEKHTSVNASVEAPKIFYRVLKCGRIAKLLLVVVARVHDLQHHSVGRLGNLFAPDSTLDDMLWRRIQFTAINSERIRTVVSPLYNSKHGSPGYLFSLS